MAENGYGAARIITTVSTEKVAKVDGLLSNGVVDRGLYDSIIDEVFMYSIANMSLG
jgi:hypothetical protein